MPSAHATILVGYLPIGRFECFSDKTRQVARYQTFHTCMAYILETLQAAGKHGVPMACADNTLRRVWPVLAAYVADYPEQCLVACCMENRCPVGQIHPDLRGSHQTCSPRTQNETLHLLQLHEMGSLQPADQERFKLLGIRAVHQPFWANLPHSDIFLTFSPDLLHQLHKGVFKDHLVKWCTSLIGEDELDLRFKTMPGLVGLRHFKNGISGVSQWTGAEHKEMEKVFVGLMAAGADERVVQAVRALLDFIYLASLQRHTSSSLTAMGNALDEFHHHKNVFIEFEARQPAHFNIPKYHMMEHYVELIRLLGSADGFNTEWSERLHIDYAKEAYRASNKKDYTIQMTVWLRRQETIDRFAMYLFWCRNGTYVPGASASDNTKTSSQGAEPGTVEFFIPKHLKRKIQRTSAVMVTPTLYRVPANHPPSLRAVPASKIVQQHNAKRFLPAVQTFLLAHNCTLAVHEYDDFKLFKKVDFDLPHIPEVSIHKQRDCVRASPPTQPSGRQKGEPAHLDFALLRTGEKNIHTDGTNLQGNCRYQNVYQQPVLTNSSGLRVARVRVIFNLPDVYNIKTTHPLAYIEWFTPMRSIDRASGLYILSPSTRQHQPYGEIVELDRIVRSCHLIPRAPMIDPSWNADNIADHCPSFFLNPYIDLHTFCMLRLSKYGCIK